MYSNPRFAQFAVPRALRIERKFPADETRMEFFFILLSWLTLLLLLLLLDIQ
jgi:hypothetical protein